MNLDFIVEVDKMPLDIKAKLREEGIDYSNVLGSNKYTVQFPEEKLEYGHWYTRIFRLRKYIFTYHEGPQTLTIQKHERGEFEKNDIVEVKRTREQGRIANIVNIRTGVTYYEVAFFKGGYKTFNRENLDWISE